MNSIRWSALAGVSASRPRMMPETTSRPWSLIFRTASRIGMRRFWSLEIDRRASGSGVSIPQNTTWKPASRISSSTRSFLAMFSVASHAKRTGKRWRRCHSTRWGRRSRAAFWLAMKLSSTK